MKTTHLIALSLAALTTAACTVTGPADDGFVNSQESLANGRLFSEDEAGYTIYRSGQADASRPFAAAATPPVSSMDIDRAAYEEWRRARESNTAEYRKFKLWQHFENIQRWRED